MFIYAPRGADMANSIERFPQVVAHVRLSRSSIYNRIKAGDFPKPISLGKNARAVGFLVAEVDAWVDAQLKRSRQGRRNRRD